MPYTLLELHSITGVEIDDRVGFVIHVDPLATLNILSFTVYLSFFFLAALQSGVWSAHWSRSVWLRQHWMMESSGKPQGWSMTPAKKKNKGTSDQNE